MWEVSGVDILEAVEEGETWKESKGNTTLKSETQGGTEEREGLG